jgi:hypothetical protein
MSQNIPSFNTLAPQKDRPKQESAINREDIRKAKELVDSFFEQNRAKFLGISTINDDFKNKAAMLIINRLNKGILKVDNISGTLAELVYSKNFKDKARTAQWDFIENNFHVVLSQKQTFQANEESILNIRNEISSLYKSIGQDENEFTVNTEGSIFEIANLEKETQLKENDLQFYGSEIEKFETLKEKIENSAHTDNKVDTSAN